MKLPPDWIQENGRRGSFAIDTKGEPSTEKRAAVEQCHAFGTCTLPMARTPNVQIPRRRPGVRRGGCPYNICPLNFPRPSGAQCMRDSYGFGVEEAGKHVLKGGVCCLPKAPSRESLNCTFKSSNPRVASNIRNPGTLCHLRIPSQRPMFLRRAIRHSILFFCARTARCADLAHRRRP